MERANTILAAAIAAGFFGGVLLALSWIVALPSALVLIGGLVFCAGVFLAFVFGFVESRRERGTLWGALGTGFRTVWEWLRAFVP